MLITYTNTYNEDKEKKDLTLMNHVRDSSRIEMRR